MINRKDRRELASLIKKLVTGKITNDDYQDQVLDLGFSDDASVAAIARRTYIGFDHPYKTIRYTGKDALNKQGRREAAKWILFLHGGYEMDRRPHWKRIAALGVFLLHVILTFATCGIYILFFIAGGMIMDRYRKRKFGGLADTWPFRNDEELESARKMRLLGANRNN